MIEQDIEGCIVDAITNKVIGLAKVVDVDPSPEDLKNVPLVVVNIESGNCEPFSMGDKVNYRVDATLTVDIICHNKTERYEVQNAVIGAINEVSNVYKITLYRFANMVNREMQKPLFIRQSTFNIKYKEVYNG